MAVRPSSSQPSAARGPVVPPSAVPMLLPQGKHLGKAGMTLSRPFTLIGSRQRAHLHLVSQSVSKAHAFIVNTDTGLYIRDLASRTHVLINDEPVVEADLHDGDIIAVGSFAFKFTDASGKRLLGRPQPAPPAALESDNSLAPVFFQGRSILVGRRPGCDIVLGSSSVSTSHAILFELNGRRYIRDLGSRTGTFVNDIAVNGHKQPLEFGDRIRVGDTEFRYSPAGAAETAESLDELEDLVGTASLAPEVEPEARPVRPASPIASAKAAPARPAHPMQPSEPAEIDLDAEAVEPNLAEPAEAADTVALPPAATAPSVRPPPPTLSPAVIDLGETPVEEAPEPTDWASADPAHAAAPAAERVESAEPFELDLTPLPAFEGDLEAGEAPAHPAEIPIAFTPSDAGHQEAPAPPEAQESYAVPAHVSPAEHTPAIEVLEQTIPALDEPIDVLPSHEVNAGHAATAETVGLGHPEPLDPVDHAEHRAHPDHPDHPEHLVSGHVEPAQVAGGKPEQGWDELDHALDPATPGAPEHPDSLTAVSGGEPSFGLEFMDEGAAADAAAGEALELDQVFGPDDAAPTVGGTLAAPPQPVEPPALIPPVTLTSESAAPAAEKSKKKGWLSGLFGRKKEADAVPPPVTPVTVAPPPEQAAAQPDFLSPEPVELPEAAEHAAAGEAEPAQPAQSAQIAEWSKSAPEHPEHPVPAGTAVPAGEDELPVLAEGDEGELDLSFLDEHQEREDARPPQPPAATPGEPPHAPLADHSDQAGQTELIGAGGADALDFDPRDLHLPPAPEGTEDADLSWLDEEVSLAPPVVPPSTEQAVTSPAGANEPPLHEGGPAHTAEVASPATGEAAPEFGHEPADRPHDSEGAFNLDLDFNRPVGDTDTDPAVSAEHAQHDSGAGLPHGRPAESPIHEVLPSDELEPDQIGELPENFFDETAARTEHPHEAQATEPAAPTEAPSLESASDALELEPTFAAEAGAREVPAEERFGPGTTEAGTTGATLAAPPPVADADPLAFAEYSPPEHIPTEFPSPVVETLEPRGDFGPLQELGEPGELPPAVGAVDPEDFTDHGGPNEPVAPGESVEPAHAEPAHAEPAHAEPAHAEPAHAEAAHAGATDTAAAHDEAAIAAPISPASAQHDPFAFPEVVSPEKGLAADHLDFDLPAEHAVPREGEAPLLPHAETPAESGPAGPGHLDADVLEPELVEPEFGESKPYLPEFVDSYLVEPEVGPAPTDPNDQAAHPTHEAHAAHGTPEELTGESNADFVGHDFAAPADHAESSAPEAAPTAAQDQEPTPAYVGHVGPGETFDEPTVVEHHAAADVAPPAQGEPQPVIGAELAAPLPFESGDPLAAEPLVPLTPHVDTDPPHTLPTEPAAAAASPADAAGPTGRADQPEAQPQELDGLFDELPELPDPDELEKWGGGLPDLSELVTRRNPRATPEASAPVDPALDEPVPATSEAAEPVASTEPTAPTVAEAPTVAAPATPASAADPLDFDLDTFWKTDTTHAESPTAAHPAPQTVAVTSAPPPPPQMATEATAGEVPPPETFDDWDLDLDLDAASPTVVGPSDPVAQPAPLGRPQASQVAAPPSVPASAINPMFGMGRDLGSFIGGMPLALPEIPKPRLPFSQVEVRFDPRTGPPPDLGSPLVGAVDEIIGSAPPGPTVAAQSSAEPADLTPEDFDAFGEPEEGTATAGSPEQWGQVPNLFGSPEALEELGNRAVTAADLEMEPADTTDHAPPEAAAEAEPVESAEMETAEAVPEEFHAPTEPQEALAHEAQELPETLEEWSVPEEPVEPASEHVAPAAPAQTAETSDLDDLGALEAAWAADQGEHTQHVHAEGEHGLAEAPPAETLQEHADAIDPVEPAPAESLAQTEHAGEHVESPAHEIHATAELGAWPEPEAQTLAPPPGHEELEVAAYAPSTAHEAGTEPARAAEPEELYDLDEPLSLEASAGAAAEGTAAESLGELPSAAGPVEHLALPLPEEVAEPVIEPNPELEQASVPAAAPPPAKTAPRPASGARPAVKSPAGKATPAKTGPAKGVRPAAGPAGKVAKPGATKPVEGAAAGPAGANAKRPPLRRPGTGAVTGPPGGRLQARETDVFSVNNEAPAVPPDPLFGGTAAPIPQIPARGTTGEGTRRRPPAPGAAPVRPGVKPGVKPKPGAPVAPAAGAGKTRPTTAPAARRPGGPAGPASRPAKPGRPASPPAPLADVEDVLEPTIDPFMEPEGVEAAAQPEAPAGRRGASRPATEGAPAAAPKSGRRLWMVLLVIVVLLTVVAAVVAVVLMKHPQIIKGRFGFKGAAGLPAETRTALRQRQQVLLADPRVRTRMRDAAKDKRLDPGFLGDGPGQPARLNAIASGADWSADAGHIVFTDADADADDRQRMTILLNVLYDESRGKDEDRGRLRGQYENAVRNAGELDKQIDDLERHIQRNRDLVANGDKMKEQAAKLKEKLDALGKECDAAAAKAHALETDLKLMEPSVSVTEPPSAVPGGPTTAPAGPSVNFDDDEQGRQLTAEFQRINDQLREAKEAREAQFGAAQKQLDAAQTQFDAQVEATKKAAGENGALAQSVATLRELQDRIRGLNDELVQQQKDQRDLLDQLKSQLAQAHTARIKRVWDEDAGLRELQVKLATAEHRANSAAAAVKATDQATDPRAAADARRNAADAKAEIANLNRLVKARQDLLDNDDLFSNETRLVQDAIDQAGEKMGVAMARNFSRLREALDALDKAKPDPKLLPQEQQALARGVDESSKALGQARERYAKEQKQISDRNDARVQKLTEELSAQQAQIDERKKQLEALRRQALTPEQKAQQELAQQQERRDQYQRKSAEMKQASAAESDAAQVYMNVRKELRERQADVQVAEGADGLLAQENTELLALRQKKAQSEQEARVLRSQLQTDPEPVAPDAASVQVEEDAPRDRILLVVVASGFGLTLLTLLPLLRATHHAHMAHPADEVFRDLPDGRTAGGERKPAARPWPRRPSPFDSGAGSDGLGFEPAPSVAAAAATPMMAHG